MNKKLQDEIRNTKIQYSGTKANLIFFNVMDGFSVQSEPDTEVDKKKLFKLLIPG